MRRHDKVQESELGSRDTQENCVVMSRRLKCRIKRQCSEALFGGQAKQTTIAELFSPPDMVLEAVRRGGVSWQLRLDNRLRHASALCTTKGSNTTGT